MDYIVLRIVYDQCRGLLTEREILSREAAVSTDILPRLKSRDSTVTDRAPTSGGSPLVAPHGGVAGRASSAPDRDSGLHLPLRWRAYPYLGLGITTDETNGDSCYGIVGFIPRLKSWAFSSNHCNYRYWVVSRVRIKTESVENDVELVAEHCEDLVKELQDAV